MQSQSLIGEKKQCWSFCNTDNKDGCALKKYGLCPTSIPLYRSPPPNDGCTSISELRFGKRDYEDMEVEYWRKISKLTKKHGYKRSITLVPHWRSQLKGIDSYAMMHIYTDPKLYEETENYIIGTGDAGNSESGNSQKTYTRKHSFPSVHPPAWNPNLLQDVLLEDINLLETIMNTNISTSIIPVVKRVNFLFENTFIPEFIEETNKILCNKLITNGDSGRRKEEFEFVLKRLPINASIFKEKGSLIVSKFLMELHFTVPEFWMARVSEMNVENIDLPDTYSKTGSSFVLDTGEKESKGSIKKKTNVSTLNIEFE